MKIKHIQAMLVNLQYTVSSFCRWQINPIFLIVPWKQTDNSLKMSLHTCHISHCEVKAQ